MTEAANKILQEALRLPTNERMDLMAALSDSLDAPEAELSPEWKAEVENRIAQVERGEVELVPWEEAEATIRKTLDRHR